MISAEGSDAGTKNCLVLKLQLMCLFFFLVNECVELVSKSKKPVIVIGSQATLPPTPVEDLRRSLENLGVPCFLGGMSRGLLG